MATVTNWMGNSDQARPPRGEHTCKQASAVVRLETSDEPMPLVTPTTPQSATIQNSRGAKSAEKWRFEVTQWHSRC